MSASLPAPYFDITRATNTLNYPGTSIVANQTTDFKQQYLYQYNLELQKQLGANVVSVGYVGQIGRHIVSFGENQNAAANPTENAAPPLSVGGQSNEGFGNLQGYPYLKTVGLTMPADIGTSFFNALQASFQRRFSKGLTVNVNYVWSHGWTTSEATGSVSFPCLLRPSLAGSTFQMARVHRLRLRHRPAHALPNLRFAVPQWVGRSRIGAPTL